MTKNKAVKKNYQYQTQGGIQIIRTQTLLDYQQGIDQLITLQDSQRGAVFSSNYEYPSRYQRWDVAFVNPPLVITSQGFDFSITALNQRGEILLKKIAEKLSNLSFLSHLKQDKLHFNAHIQRDKQRFAEEYRSRQASIFSILREIVSLFFSEEDEHLGLYGAFGYDLVHQFEELHLKIKRDLAQRDLVLYLPDELVIVDHQRQLATNYEYDFIIGDQTTKNLARTGIIKAFIPSDQQTSLQRDHLAGEYAKTVAKALDYFRRGDLFEVVPSQSFFRNVTSTPSTIFKTLQKQNPAPFGSLINLGEDEFLVGASPEMFIRVSGRHIESCPISGTIKRGDNAIEDAQQILTLLNSQKDSAELTMCTDVDRNDKSRICIPGSVKVIGRRQIELYSRLIHTVDHVVGQLRSEFDAIDAFLSHIWVVTVTGAPKIWAMQFIEDHEKSQRRWYGGAIGWLNFNGDLSTGLTIRTMRIKEAVAEVRAGATILYDSDPLAEEQETELKASAFIDAIIKPAKQFSQQQALPKKQLHKRILLVDHQDSFVHTLANYFKQFGAELVTWRSGFSEADFKQLNCDCMVLSPGPGKPSDFNLHKTIQMAIDHNVAIFGVCLGLQGLVEYFGGQLKTLTYPMHGKASCIEIRAGKLFKNLPQQFSAARYHSLYADPDTLPNELMATAYSQDGIIMAIEHQHLPIWAVQFHPESILSQANDVGLRIIENVMQLIK